MTSPHEPEPEPMGSNPEALSRDRGYAQKVFNEMDGAGLQAAIEDAIMANDEELACWLVKNHPWLSWKSEILDGPMRVAINSGMNKAVIAMLKRGAKKAPYHFEKALRLGNRDIAQLFIDKGYKLTRSPGILCGCLREPELLQWLIDNGADPNSYETRGGGTTTMLVCPLDQAAMTGTTSNVTYLLEHGALLDFSNALFHAVRRTTSPEEALEMTKFLIEQGADVNKIFHDHLPKWTHNLREHRDLGTVYHEAIARNKSDELIQVLLDAGANPNALSKNGLTAQEWKEKRYCSNRKHEV